MVDDRAGGGVAGAPPAGEGMRAAREAARSKALLRSARLLSGQLQLNTVLELVASETARALHVPVVSIYLYEAARQALIFQTGFGIPPGLGMQLRPVPLADFRGFSLHRGEPIVTRDVRAAPEVPAGELAARLDLRTHVSAIMRHGSELVGTLNVASQVAVRDFDADELAFLQGLADQATLAIRNATLFRQVRRHVDDLNLLFDVATACSSSLDLDQVLHELALRLTAALDIEGCAISLWDHERDELVTLIDYGPDLDWWEPVPPGTRYPLADYPASRHVLLDRVAYGAVQSDPSIDPAERAWMEADEVLSLLMVPMIAGGRAIGLLEMMDSRYERGFSAAETDLCQALANQAATAVQNAHLFTEVSRRATIQETLNNFMSAATRAEDVNQVLETSMDHALDVLQLDAAAVWAGDHGLARNLPEGSLEAIRAAAPAVDRLYVRDGYGEADPPLPALESALAERGFPAWLLVPAAPGDDPAAGLLVLSPVPRRWTGIDIMLVEGLGHELGATVERLTLLAHMRRQTELLIEVGESVPGAIVILDAGLRVTLANSQAGAWLPRLGAPADGVPLTQLGGRPIVDLLTSPPDGLWHELRIDEPPAQIFELIARPLEDASGTHGWVVVFFDLTRERTARARAEQHERLATVGRLAAGIAHDFNNILAVVVLHAQMILRTAELSAANNRRLETIEQQAKHATALVQQILDFGRGSALDRRPANLLPLLEEQVTLLRHTLPDNIEIELVAAGGLCQVSVDVTGLQQVIMNLAANARDAMPDGGRLTIHVDQIHVASPKEAPLPGMGTGSWVRLAVADTGVGIPADHLPRVFDPFFTTKEVGHGTGLGLPQVYGIVQQHNGHIDVASARGEGTTFTIYLPAVSPCEPCEPIPVETPLARGSGQLILLVEDDQGVRGALQASLEMLDYRVLPVENGRRALQLLDERDGEIALILTDLAMPEMGGRALVEALAARQDRPPVVALTGHLARAQRQALEAAGALAVLQKPPELEQLAAVVAQAVHGGRGAAGL
jgi:signal transduction histidine kinase/transcriptional regulator with GAF, ATPase, and Fis domain/ActR/RegA family two-component response regulator